MPRAAGQQGFTVIEIVVTIVILSIALLGIVAILRMGSARTADNMIEVRAIALGQAYLDEIMAKRFDENSASNGLTPCLGLATDMPAPARPCTSPADFGVHDNGESGTFPRRKFDDVDDYHGLAEGFGETDPAIKDAEGEDKSEYENFHVDVDVSYMGDDASWGSLGQTQAKLVKVRVRHQAQDVDEGWVFSSIKGNY